MSPQGLLIAVVCGALFGFGLALSTMIRPEVVLSFLRFQDFGLLLVLGGALVVTAAIYQLAPRMQAKPMVEGVFETHPAVMNRDTVVGAAIFGAGWGLCGVCPGPAIAGLGAGNASLLVAVAAILVGAYAQGRFFGRLPPTSAPKPA